MRNNYIYIETDKYSIRYNNICHLNIFTSTFTFKKTLAFYNYNFIDQTIYIAIDDINKIEWGGDFCESELLRLQKCVKLIEER